MKVNEKSKDKLKENSVEEVRDETLKFLALCATGEKHYSPSAVVDEYWHALIVNTRVYAETAKLSGKFIHHVPSDYSTESVKSNMKGYQNTIEAYREAFGALNPKIWGSFDSECEGGDCGNCWSED